MCQFPALPSPGLCVQPGAQFGDPRIEACQQLPEAYRSYATSFIGSWRQDIHRTPLVT
jgi:hypothetical protein